MELRLVCLGLEWEKQGVGVDEEVHYGRVEEGLRTLYISLSPNFELWLRGCLNIRGGGGGLERVRGRNLRCVMC